MSDVDPVAVWQETYGRVRDLVASTDPDELERTVPACPAWTGRELLSHMIGLGADVLAGAEDDDHNASWTQAQVDARRDHAPAELLAEWAEIAERLPDWMRANDPRPLGDITIHEQDLRGALGAPGGRDNEGIAIVRDRMAGRLGDGVEDLAPLALVGDGWRWASSGDAEAADVVVRAGDFDLFRALTSRRTADQLRGWTERGDVAPYLDAFAALGALPDEPLPE
ncbi:maleylpyruvate isomerase family mycothiol-dependent enzyme [Nocardioides mangrovicus]|uniref:Maleylpyruvate isomerase family mycothiol-dependent enzyme n=1 Tax=Nocardioides mangrovicus TaxID=2478913 RepID=A0A3L8NXI9_9ACTN|nr:maleylpyruvate isomerase family mycothiol-dependent enzyme [Nocardioides mangrovicus]RLV47905.1 maleylpyruvate isomerase family mycothiol-dependent enzyme [Nocardioides mangrovicus]